MFIGEGGGGWQGLDHTETTLQKKYQLELTNLIAYTPSAAVLHAASMGIAATLEDGKVSKAFSPGFKNTIGIWQSRSAPSWRLQNCQGVYPPEQHDK